jgi:Protein of unknown function (DUF3631)
MPKKTTSAQTFANIFARFTSGSTPEERETAERMMDAWLRRRGKTRIDIQSVLVQAAADDLASQPPPPPSDPRDAQPHPFDDPRFTPVGLVHGIVTKYLTMRWYVAVIFSLWICFTHVQTWFRIVPRVALVSEGPDSGKTTALDVARCLVLRPNPEALGTAAAIADFLDEGPCTVLLDELDHVDPEARRRLQPIWNLGHKRGVKRSMMVKGRRKLVSLHAPMMAAGIGTFLGPTQTSRTFMLEMEPYTEKTKPEREFDENDAGDLDQVYRFLHHWAPKARLNPKPAMPGVIRRAADNVRGLLAIADSCGPEWGQRAREALTFLLAKEKAERSELVMVRHGLAILDALGLEQIGSVRFNRELRRLDLPDARWTRYRGPSGTEHAHPIEMYEQAALLEKVGIKSVTCWPTGRRERGGSFKGYKREQFEEAHRKYCAPDDAGPGAPRLRLVVAPTSE